MDGLHRFLSGVDEDEDLAAAEERNELSSQRLEGIRGTDGAQNHGLLLL